MQFDFASVIIPTYNKKERLRLVLESFNYQTAASGKFELIIVDDGSTDGTGEYIKGIRCNYRLRYIYQENRGRSGARNSGIRAARDSLLIFCDDDTIPAKEFIKKHLSAHSKTGKQGVHGTIYNLPYLKFFKDPVKGTLYDRVTSSHSDPVFLKRHLLPGEGPGLFDKIDAQKKLSLFEKQVKSTFSGNFRRLQWLGFTGGNVSAHRQLILEAGMFDEDFGTTWGGEDLELGYRLYLLGVEFIYCEEARNYHITHHRCDFRGDLEVSARLFYEKHPVPVIDHLAKLLTGEVKEVADYLNLVKRTY